MPKIQITPTIVIDSSELREKFVTSSGPGGQNVNKVATAVQLKFDVAGSTNIPFHVRNRILASGDKRLTVNGELVIVADRHRTQEANRRDAVERLSRIIASAAVSGKKRIATKPTRAAVRKRLENKTRRASLKKSRSGKIELE